MNAIEVAHRCIHQVEARPVCPLEILEHEQDRTHGELGLEPVVPRGADPVAHPDRILAGSLERGAPLLVEGGAAQLPEEVAHLGELRAGDVLAQPEDELAALYLDRLAGSEPGEPADRGRRQAEG